MKPITINHMIRILSIRLSLNPIDRDFIRTVARDSNNGADTSALSGEQVERVAAIFEEQGQ